jgi:hypothetical protein
LRWSLKDGAIGDFDDHRPDEEIDMPKKTPPVDQLIEEVEALCKVYCGKNAEGELWGQTCLRINRLNQILKKIRRQNRRLAIALTFRQEEQAK